MTEKQCPICGRSDCSVTLKNIGTSEIDNQPDLFYSGNCICCGDVYVSRTLVDEKVKFGLIDKREFLGCLRRHTIIGEQNERLDVMPIRTVEDLREGVVIPSTPLDQVGLLIDYIAFKQTSLSEPTRLDSSKDYPICFSLSESDFCYIIDSAYKLGYIKGRGNDDDPIMDNGGRLYLKDEFILLTLDGWGNVQELKEQSPYSKQVFVAFHFDGAQAMKRIYDSAIKPAVIECGLKPYVTLDDEHGNSINDVIIANIRKSRIVIADVTDASQNVYYEAGFAYGLGIPVILTCLEDRAKKDLKFDTSHIKHILWKDGADLKEKLINRIVAMGLNITHEE